MLAAAGALLVSAALMSLVGPRHALASLAVSVATFAAVYATLLLGLGLSREDRMVLARVRTRLGFDGASR